MAFQTILSAPFQRVSLALATTVETMRLVRTAVPVVIKDCVVDAPREMVVNALRDVGTHVARSRELRGYRPQVIQLPIEDPRPYAFQGKEEDLIVYDNDPEFLRTYRVNRGIDECSTLSAQTSFGAVEFRVRRKILEKRRVGDASPVSILSIGPGEGLVESRLKEIFLTDVAIDSLALTDRVPHERRWAFRTLYLGNMDRVAWPELGYDCLFSFFGLFHSNDLPLALDNIQKVLTDGGEGFFNYRMVALEHGREWNAYPLPGNPEMRVSSDGLDALFYCRK